MVCRYSDNTGNSRTERAACGGAENAGMENVGIDSRGIANDELSR